MGNEDFRWKQRFDSFHKALQHLKNAVELYEARLLTKLEMLGVVNIFEFTHELAWKTLKDLMEGKGNNGLYGSKDITRKAFQLELIEDGEGWMRMIECRNLSSHTYNEETADKIVSEVIDQYYGLFMALEDKLNVCT